MRPRTFILLIVVLLLLAVVVVLIIANSSGGGPLAGLFGGNGDNGGPTTQDGDGEEPLQPPPTPTPSLQPVVVSKLRIPVGEALTEEFLTVENRPITNVAIQGGYTFTDTTTLIGRLTKVEIQRGQEILAPMLALNVTDLAGLGSDLSLYVDNGKVALAFPMNRFTGAAFAMRPGDFIDVLMTLRITEIDPTFGSALPNNVERVIQSALLEGTEFLFPPIQEGRLEFVPEINQVAAIIPSTLALEGQDFERGRPIPKRTTQLTIQQAEVLWVGTWFNRQDADRLLIDAILQSDAAQAAAAAAAAEGEEAASVPSQDIEPLPERIHERPDVVILSMPVQDALALNWALERGVDIDLALRSPGDSTSFVTTSVSLPQILDQGALAIPEQTNFDLHPAASEVLPPFLLPESIEIKIIEVEILDEPVQEEEGTP